MRYEMKIVNRADNAATKKFRAADRTSMRFVRERYFFLEQTPSGCARLFFSVLSLFFSMKASNERNFVAGYLSALTVPRCIPSLLFSPRFCREFFIQTMLKYILCTQYNSAKASSPPFTRTREPEKIGKFSTCASLLQMLRSNQF